MSIDPLSVVASCLPTLGPHGSQAAPGAVSRQRPGFSALIPSSREMASIARKVCGPFLVKDALQTPSIACRPLEVAL